LRDILSTMQLDPHIHVEHGVVEYCAAMLELCTVGESLTHAAVDHAEMLRRAINAKSDLDSKNVRAQNLRLTSGRADLISDERLLETILEQHQDVRTYLHKVMEELCQARIYQMLIED